MRSDHSITPENLNKLLGTADAPPVFDVRIDEDVADDPVVIPTARRLSHRALEALAEALVGQCPVIVCQKGRKLSQGAAALLRTRGIRAVVLEGGSLAWAQCGLPRIPLSALPRVSSGQDSLWVGRLGGGIDQAISAWLVRRFVDPEARFLCVEPAEVDLVASRFDAVPLTAEVGLHAFRPLLDQFGLQIGGLRKMADLIDAMVSERWTTAPEALGLSAIWYGFSASHLDDPARIEAGIAVFDALYLWARDSEETGPVQEAQP